MKKLLLTVALIVFSVSTSMAAETIVLKAKIGDVTFPHKEHQEMLTDCKPCHEKEPGKIADFGKDSAHKLCKGCHEAKKQGPVKCYDCHKK